MYANIKLRYKIHERICYTFKIKRKAFFLHLWLCVCVLINLMTLYVCSFILVGFCKMKLKTKKCMYFSFNLPSDCWVRRQDSATSTCRCRRGASGARVSSVSSPPVTYETLLAKRTPMGNRPPSRFYNSRTNMDILQVCLMSNICLFISLIHSGLLLPFFFLSSFCYI